MVNLTHDILLGYFKDKLNVDTNGIEAETLLFSSGLVDSFSLVDLILFIEKTCETKVKPLEVNLNNLDSINRILTFVEKRNNQG